MSEAAGQLHDHEQRLRTLEAAPVGVYGVLPYSTDNVSNPPTDAEIDAAFGTPATVGEGFRGTINDNGGNVNVWGVASTGTTWHYWAMTLAV
jgi:hypothetical protein